MKVFKLLLVSNEQGFSSFTGLQSTIHSNPRTLSKKLKLLQNHELIEKGQGLYKLTERGKQFFWHYTTLCLF